MPTTTSIDPFRTAELAIELQVERMKVAEVLAARDTLVQRLADAYISIQQKNKSLERLAKKCGTPLSELINLSTPDLAADHHEKQKLIEQVAAQQTVINQLQEELKNRKCLPKSSDPPPCYEENLSPVILSPNIQNEGDFYPFPRAQFQWGEATPAQHLTLPALSRTTSQSSIPATLSDIGINDAEEPETIDILPRSNNAADRIRARNVILAALPIPLNGPPDDLQPIMIPAPLTLQEFINSGSSFLRNSLSNYRQLHELTTSWCEEKEEHGYFLTPVFKCSTNPRVVTAHRWNFVDVLHRMTKPTEFFYSKNGHWYYAGIYKAFRMEDLTTKEWEALSTETTSAIVKDTILARKNLSPQNVYEITQLYACGALKVACIGLQCVGFNGAVFNALMDHANKYAQAALNAVPPPGGGFPWTSTHTAGVSNITEKMAALTVASPSNRKTDSSATEDASKRMV